VNAKLVAEEDLAFLGALFTAFCDILRIFQCEMIQLLLVSVEEHVRHYPPSDASKLSHNNAHNGDATPTTNWTFRPRGHLGISGVQDAYYAIQPRVRYCTMLLNDELGWMWKEAAVYMFKLSRHFLEAA
jgi:hypothetical protein